MKLTINNVELKMINKESEIFGNFQTEYFTFQAENLDILPDKATYTSKIYNVKIISENFCKGFIFFEDDKIIVSNVFKKSKKSLFSKIFNKKSNKIFTGTFRNFDQGNKNFKIYISRGNPDNFGIFEINFFAE